MTLPIRKGLGGAINEPPPRRKHSERQPGESYPDALTRVAGERDAALHDVARLEREVARLAALRIEEQRAAADELAAVSRDLGLYDHTDGPTP